MNAVLNFIHRNDKRKPEMTNEFRSQYEYAQRNGYTGTYKQYVVVQYDAYCNICKRQEITPLSYAEWVKG